MAFTLPALPYAADALEPHIDKQTMEIHHGKHHNAYMTNLNEALEKAPCLASRPPPLFRSVNPTGSLLAKMTVRSRRFVGGMVGRYGSRGRRTKHALPVRGQSCGPQLPNWNPRGAPMAVSSRHTSLASR